MNKPILTATTVATGLNLAIYTPKTVTAAYTFEGTGYTSKLKLTRNEDGLFIACPTCGCPVRQLHKNETRPGLCCVDCLSRAEQKAAAADDRKANVRRRKKVA
ncbi:MAG: hypothetical protein ABI947_14460 [Chloroflexota bacterium]